MKRGFLNTPRYKRAIDDAYAPASPPGPEPLRQKKPSSPPYCTPDGGEEADAAQGATKVEMTAVQDVYADGRIVAVRVMRPDERGAKAPSGSRDDKDGTKDEPPSKAKGSKGKDKGKGKAKNDDDPDASYIAYRPSHHRQGWGRDPEEEFFHVVPQSHGGPHKKRAVFRLWPRRPNGKHIISVGKHAQGTLSPDGYPWGATLYDFYNVNKLPGVTYMLSIMTGSSLCEVMKVLGELDVAAPEIEWAKSEGKPRVEGAADTEELIGCIDMRLRLQSHFNFAYENVNCGRHGEEVEEQGKEDSDIAEQAAGDEDGDGADGNEEDHEEADEQDSEQAENDSENEYDSDDTVPIFIPPAPTIPVSSPFHPSHYPKPWPFTPFETPLSILLQERIPLYLLPRTLYVHDPFCLLTACERSFRNTSWTSRPDIIRTYNLHLSDSVRFQVEEARRKAEELEEFKARTLIILRYNRTKEQIESHEPMIEVPLPPYPRRLTKVEESHLYISPIAKAGQGHHSIVYKGEWELPRDVFTKTRICRLCFKESADKEVQRLKDTGRWEKMLRAASWGPNGFTGREPTQADLDAVCDPTNLKRDGEIIERTDIWDKLMKQKQVNNAVLRFAQDVDGDEGGSDDSPVAVIRIDPPFTYESQNSCTHKSHMYQGPVPRTAKFTVVAKLSIENDHHLAREASNYQKFPEHFFQHYNGYTLISQLHSIVPVNAVVPQFYGYYTPKEKGKTRNPGQPHYLSPILLLEHCGKPIEPEELSDEDQEECASLLLRFQRAGWLHESVAPRNFLIQLGKPTEFPLMRECKPEPSFRLIDFGRSRKYDTTNEKREEEMEALKMFKKLRGKMGVTLS